MTTPTLGLLLTATAFVNLSAFAQEAAPLGWTLEEFRTRCIPLWSNEPTAVAEDCTVAELDGTIKIQFEWDDLTLRVASFEHDPGAQ